MQTISIVITTYKRPVLLTEAVESCIAQTYPPTEIVIGDDSPDEYTREAVEKIRKNTSIPIRYIHNKPSLKQARNVNMLFDAAKSDYVMLLHDDDLLMPESLETLVDVFRQHPSVKVAYGKQYIIDENGKIDHHSSERFNEDFYRVEKYEGNVLSSFEAGLSQQFPNNGYLMSKEVIDNIRWRYDVGNGCEYDFGYRVGLSGYEIHFVNKFLGKYRLSQDCMSHSKSADQAYYSYLILKNSRAETPVAKEIRTRRLLERAPIAITEAVNVGKRSEAIKILFGQWYRKRIFTPRGMKRVAYILFYVDVNKIKTKWLQQS